MKFNFPEDKINNIVGNIKIINIPETKNLISIKTYQ